jgi:hypothetical protein
MLGESAEIPAEDRGSDQVRAAVWTVEMIIGVGRLHTLLGGNPIRIPCCLPQILPRWMGLLHLCDYAMACL